MGYVWGVDSAARATEDLYNCVLNNFGKPEFWGRYLTTVEGASEGLTREEVELLHNSGTKVLPIYNRFRDATGNRQGRVTARNTIFQAERLGIPKGTVLFANVERFFDVDAEWIKGYVDVFYPSGYRPGFYHDPVEGNFSSAYCQAVSENEQVAIQSILWSAEPDPGVTRRREAPAYNPQRPPCRENVWGWQYGRDAESCPIDTNLIDERLYEMLW
ncbi:uncharacterized protein DUF1906 [Melghiribacillus thermohalophilus]|uniref:Uncharacterized protein DUF1906 n=1 Tax=Melghiribacillus thermohalophilus TaxID=1324956 RepID=A0A4R3MW17_9BACI|nr:glycoside hydrolase domain-containing protein [Melghiribacillus thermohalophilus]TCT19631.1 uncharacterized protein DUF1906 [Melghiribacillus thermohalophilus]